MKRRTTTLIRRAVVETLETRRLFNFAAPTFYAVGPHSGALATGDFNGDGRSDVITANEVANSVTVRLSSANGTLQAAQSFAAGGAPGSIAVGDVNNDGKRDVVAANAGGNVSVLLGNGNGTFAAPLTAALPPQFPPGYTGGDALPQQSASVAVGDLNADGKLELVVGALAAWNATYISYWGQPYERTVTHGYVNVLIGNGNGTFGATNAYAQYYTPTTVAVADFNNDAKPDVLADPYSSAIYLGNGNGTLQPPVFSTYSGRSAIGDFDRDGKLDLVIGGTALFKGLGNGTFQNPVIILNDSVRSAVAGDVNGDGKLDLIAGTQRTTFAYYGYYGGYYPTTTDYTKVLLGHGDGTFARPITTVLDSRPDYGSPPNASALGDFNGDGRPDLVATDPVTQKLYVQLNEPDWFVPGTLSISDAMVTEGHAGTVNAVFTVTLGDPPPASVTVNYTTADGDATAGEDYVATSGSLTFAPGQTTKTIAVQVKGDRVGEADELFYVNLGGEVNADMIDGQGVGTITDDEPRVSIGSASVTEGNTGTTPATFTVTLSAPSDLTSTVTLSTLGDTAVSGRDFEPSSGTITFLPGQTSKTFTVPVRGDAIDEYDEVFYVMSSDATNAWVAGAPGTGTILDNDAPGSIVVSDVRRAEGNSGTTPFTFTISLLAPSEKYVSFAYATANGTATSATQGGKQDYRPASYYAHGINPGQTSTTVTVYVNGDTRSESDETFLLNLSDPRDVTIADAQGVGTILNDESRGKRWVGPATGGSWSTASNWSPSGVPTADSLVTIAGSAVALPSGATVSELSLNGAAALTLPAGGGRVFRTAGLFLDEGAKLDLRDNDLVVDYAAGSSPYAALRDLVKQGIASGAGGLEVDPGPANDRALGLLDTAGTTVTQWRGVAVDATTVIGRYTYYGDGTMDGRVTGEDYGPVDASLGKSTIKWTEGDYNMDGVVSGEDYGFVDANLGKGTAAPAPVATARETVVTEPAPAREGAAANDPADGEKSHRATAGDSRGMPARVTNPAQLFRGGDALTETLLDADVLDTLLA